MTEPKVAIIHDHLIQDGGAERVLRALMSIWPKAPIYTLLYDPVKMGPDFAGKDIRESYLRHLPGARKHYKALLPLIDSAFRSFNLSEYDLVVSSSSGWAKSVRIGSRTMHVCYCHTPTRYLWSDSQRYVRELPYPRFVKLAINALLPRLRKHDLRAVAGVDVFVANSQHVARRITEYYQRDSTVINPPVAIEQFSPSPNVGDYFLVASRLEPYKRIDIVITALGELKLPLKVMGDGSDRARLARLAGPTVEFLGRVTDEQRRTLFAEAQALLNPQEEDFGITVVESLASGTPVIAYAVGGATEILSDGVTGQLFEPQTAQAITQAVRQFDRRRFDPAVLRRRAEAFSEPHFAKQLKQFVLRKYRQFRRT